MVTYVLQSSKEYKLVEFIDSSGKSPYGQWFQGLDPLAAAKVTVAVLRLVQGNDSNVKWFKGMGEYKIDYGPGYRIYLAKIGDMLILLLGGGTKKTQKKDIKKAILSFDEYKKLRKLEGKNGAH